MCERLTVYRTSLGDCTNGGISSKDDIVFKDCGSTFCKVPEEKRFRSEKRAPNYWALVMPAKKGFVGPTYGGNLAEGSDSYQTIYRIHDRFETWAQYEMMST